MEYNILSSILTEGEKSIVKDYVIPILGMIIGIGLNLTPGVLFYELNTGKKKLSDIPEFMFVSNVFNCSINLGYSIIISNKMLMISNLICTSITLFYSSIYLWHYSEKQFKLFFLYLFMAYNLTLEIIYATTQAFLDLAGQQEFKEVPSAQRIIGGITIFLTVINAGAPGQKIFTVISTGNYNLIPIVTTIFQCFCSTFWGIYGIILWDYNVYIPNGLGIFLTAFQIIIYFINYSRFKDQQFDENNQIIVKSSEKLVFEPTDS